MGRLLERLLADSESAPAATPATLATLRGPSPGIVAESQESQGGDAEKAKRQRAHLLALAADEGLPAGLVHGLDDADVAACDGYPDDALRAYLHALRARERTDKGLTPLEWGEPVTRTCEGCGPVLLWAECPATVKACPWCFRRKAGKPIAEGCPPCRGRGCHHCRRFRESLPSMSGLVKMPEAKRDHCRPLHLPGRVLDDWVRPSLRPQAPADHGGRSRGLSGARSPIGTRRHVALLPGAGHRTGGAARGHR